MEGDHGMSTDHAHHSATDYLESRTLMRDETTATYSADDEAAVRDLFRKLLDDWGRGDGHSYGSRFTEDADYIAFDGSYTKGREEISSWHQTLFDRWLKGTRLTGRIEGIRFLSPEVALVHATGGTVARGKSVPSPERDSIQTLVAVKRDGEWRFAAFHNNRVRPIGRNPATFLVWMLSDLPWRILRRNKRTTHK
jgi:uncharacterized protein (TIGR02246 family)